MTVGSSQALGSQGESRVRSGSNVRTAGPDPRVSANRSQAITSTDWRRREPAASSPIAPPRRLRPGEQSYDQDGILRVRLDLGSEASFSAPQYRFPREQRAPWGTALSAPTWQAPSSPSSTSEDAPTEAIPVHIRSINPITANVNGEVIAVPSQFSIDVDPTNPRCAARRFEGAYLRYMNQVRNNAPDLREMARRWREGDSSDSLMSLWEQQAAERDSNRRFENLVYRLQRNHEQRCLERQASDRQTREEEARNRQPLSPAHGIWDEAVLSCRPANPATMALRADAPTRQAPGDLDTVAANNFLAERLRDMHNAGHRPSADSGYVSNDQGHISGDNSAAGLGVETHPRAQEPSSANSQSKRLNPLAPEFVSQAGTANAPWMRPGPRRMARQPLTNIFPDAMSGHGLRPAVSEPQGQLQPPPVMGQPGNHDDLVSPILLQGVTGAVTMVGLHPSAAAINGPVGPFPMGMPTRSAFNTYPPPPNAPQPAYSQPVQPVQPCVPVPPGFPTGLHGGPSLQPPHVFEQVIQPPPGFEHLGPRTRTMVRPPPGFEHLGPRPCAPSRPPAGFEHVLDNPPPRATLPPPGPPQQQLQPALPIIPAAPTAAATAGPPPSTALVPAQAQVPAPALVPARPYFPVTTKPRDRDPVKQQMYEAYLEWRKANEPGYHMKCKMRQAQRVTRQLQLSLQLHQPSPASQQPQGQGQLPPAQGQGQGQQQGQQSQQQRDLTLQPRGPNTNHNTQSHPQPQGRWRWPHGSGPNTGMGTDDELA